MAKAIAHITGTALVPGVSKNRRWYTPEIIAGAVAKAQRRIGGDGLPLTMMTHHSAEDDSTRIIGRVTSVFLGEDGSAKFTADIADTEHGRTVAALVDSTDGQPFLRTVSIRGAWEGKVRRVTGPDGQPAEQGEALALDGWDLTKSPGVSGAQIDAFAWATGDQTETTERVAITESVQEARVTISEETTAEGAPEVPEGVREALAALFTRPVDEASLPGTVSMSKRKSGMSGGGRKYADPGYQADKKQRYDITDKAHAVTAWRYINQASKAAKYSSAQLKQIKARIRAALKDFGVKTEAELPGWTFEAYQVTDEVAEFYGDPSTSGSWSVHACNGPVSLHLSSYSMDPSDLDPVLRAAVDAACLAMKRLDPDMDGDVDVPGAGGSDTDGDAGKETATDDDAAETDNDPATETGPTSTGGEGPAAAGETERGDPAMAEETTTTQAGGAAPAGLTLESVQRTAAEAAAAAVTAAFDARDKAKAKAKRDRKEAAEREAREAAARKTALTEALSELGIKVPGQAGGNGQDANESGDGNAPLTEEAVQKRVDDAVSEALLEFKQQLVGAGAILPSRTGIAIREHAVPSEDNAPTAEDLAKMGDDDLMSHLGGAMGAEADRVRPVGAQA